MMKRRTLLASAAAGGLVRPALAAPRALTVGVADLPPTLEPGRELSNVGTRITYSMFDTLIRRDFLSAPGGGGAALLPGLAERWTRNADGGLDLKLRSGVRFHNGEELTAADVAFTFGPERMTGPNATLPEGRAYFGVLSGVEALDPLTVRFSTRAHDPLLEQRLASWTSWIINRKDWQAKAAAGTVRDPVGTGPYRLAEYRADQRVVLEAFPQYFGGAPAAPRVSFRKVPEPAARLAGLVSGEFDVITNVEPDQVTDIARYPGVEPRTVVLANVHVLVYNTGNPVLRDKRIRQALNLSIDRELLVKALWNGKAEVPRGHQFPEFGNLYNPARPRVAFDPDKARALLKQAGYKGQTITYATQGNYYTNATPAAQAIIEMWDAVGIKGEIQLTENVDRVPLDKLMVRNWSNSTRYPDPVGAIWIGWGANGNTQKVWKTWQDAPPRFNELGLQLETGTDPAARKGAFQELLDIWEDEAPGTILYQPVEAYGVRKDVRWTPYTFYYMDLRPYNLSFA